MLTVALAADQEEALTGTRSACLWPGTRRRLFDDAARAGRLALPRALARPPAGVGPGASSAFGFTWAWRFISITVGRTHTPSSIRGEVSGVGEGIYVSYLFTWLWTGDMIWWWIGTESYAARSVWIGRVLHSFMLFIVFNGMVVYESGLIRWVGLAMFAGLAVAWVAVRRLPKVRAA